MIKYSFVLLTLILGCSAQGASFQPILEWKLQTESKIESVYDLSDRSLIDLTKNFESLEYKAHFLKPHSENLQLILPPTWVPFTVSINGEDLTPAQARRAVKGEIYSSNKVLIPSSVVRDHNEITIIMSGPPQLIGFRGDYPAIISKANNTPLKYLLHDYLLNTTHSQIYIFISIFISLLALVLSRVHQKHQRIWS